MSSDASYMPVYRAFSSSASVGSLRGFLFPDARRLEHRSHWKNTLQWHPGPATKVRIPASKSFRHSGITAAFKTTFDVFTSVGPDNTFERLTERSVGLVADQPSDIYELLVTLLE